MTDLTPIEQLIIEHIGIHIENMNKLDRAPACAKHLELTQSVTAELTKGFESMDKLRERTHSNVESAIVNLVKQGHIIRKEAINMNTYYLPLCKD